ncbi:SusC/RagA family TonB-linked outer membrane protein [Hymenobacter swuensis]|uniref:Secretin/TonB short N-terminal domain-containing protein n=1 Tax=Hymenobacter swuensis DY53 TaxID=1227739 RepID=W8FB72_9BACT|nr:SusC/RagA family TonB-linked outer membrane protein [Hymenobacter swuensis]AHJ99891.1 hypothetical protein Hsw_4296 [Hymenobacter swuensis DY53]
MKCQALQVRMVGHYQLSLVTGLLLIPTLLVAQTPQPTITLHLSNQEVSVVLREVERQSQYTFVYSNSQVNGNQRISADFFKVPLEQALIKVLQPLGLTYQLIGRQIIVTRQGPPSASPIPILPAESRGTYTLRGRVLDAETGTPLPGASVVVQGTPRGTAASAAGEFTLVLAPTDSVVVVSSMGFTAQKVRPDHRTPLEVRLQTELRPLTEVVVTAFGLARERKALGYSVQALPGAQLTVAREPNFINAASGKLAGVHITRSGSGPMGSTNIIIRGYTSLTRDSRPLIVVDGVPIDNRNALQATRLGGYDSGDGLSVVNPEDIDNISVLKGGNAAALYGNRAANGVLLITTKKGRRGLGLTVSSNTTFDRAQVLTDYQNEYGQGTQGRFLSDSRGQPVLTPEGYPQVEAAGENIGSWGPRMEGQLVKHWNGAIKPFTAQPNNVRDFFQLGYTTANTVALSAGTARSTLRISATDLRNRGTYPNSRLARNYLTVKGSTNISSRLSVEVKASYVYARTFNRPTLGVNPDNVMSQFQHLPRSVDLADLQPYRNPLTLQPILWNQNQGTTSTTTSRQNPYWAAYLNTNFANQHRLNGSVAVRYDFADWLWLQLRAGTDRYRSDLGYRYASYTSWNATATPDRGGLSESELTMREDNLDFILHARQRLGVNWVLTGEAFGNLLQKRMENQGVTGLGFVRPNVFRLDNVASATPVYGFSRFEVQSLFGRAQLDFRNAVFLEATGRNDWDSTLPRGDWSYFYPSTSLAVGYTELLGWKSSWLTLGKLRASWARVGKGAGPYELTTKYDLTTSGIPNGPGVGTAHLGQPFATLQDQLATLRLKPQLTQAVELGSEMRFGRNRASLDVTVYRTNTYNQVTSVPLAASSGFRTQLINAGNIQNQGLEVVATVTPLHQRLSWDVTLNWATNRSEVRSLNQGGEVYQLGTESNNVAVVAQVGRPFGDLYGTRLRRAPDGQLLVDANGLPLSLPGPAERLGNFQPQWFGGLHNQLSYRQFQVGLLLDARWGGQIYSVSQQQATLFGNDRRTLPGRADWYASEAARLAAGVSAANWVATGGLLVEGVQLNPDNTYSPSSRYVNPQQYWARLANFSEPFVYDASFVKLRELTLTYQLPTALASRMGRLRGASISLVARNVAFLYRATRGFDPESGYNLSRAQGLESGGYPNSRTLGYHLILDF